MTKLMNIAIAATTALVGLASTSASAATTLYSNRGSFLSALGAQVTDSYSPAQGYAPGFSILSNAAMSAVFGETDYETTGFSNLNIVGGAGPATYCAGCNGSFRLTFTSTSVGTASGVFGAGADILFHGASLQGPYTALVNFGDSSSAVYALALGNSFFGISSDQLIRSITFGPNPSNTTGGAIGIDNLTIGSEGSIAAVPEPASWALMIAGFGLVGSAMRRRKPSVSVSYA
jgi:PEP-CTERM motif